MVGWGNSQVNPNLPGDIGNIDYTLAVDYFFDSQKNRTNLSDLGPSQPPPNSYGPLQSKGGRKHSWQDRIGPTVVDRPRHMVARTISGAPENGGRCGVAS